MPQIHVLDNGTIDKIAAGEVVERPSSVVKELVENAIDAGADSITVEIKEGGISLIRVTDNGCGIDKTDVKTAFLRHATSKIRTVEDLLSVPSLGFRGEALSSIASVAQVELITKTAQELTGIRYCMEGGMESDYAEIGAPNGTTILVRNLFFNTPARKKFLKTAATEGGYISDLMEHMAMSKPHIAFQYMQNGQTKFHTSGNGDLKEIVYRIYGRDISTELLKVDASMDGIRMFGYLGKPAINRSTRSYENYFVNGRYIKSDLIAKGLEEGYKSYLMQHKYPFTVLHFEVDGELLDVNVHPTKMEIRFLNQMSFYEFLVRSVEDALHQREMIPAVILTPEEKEPSDKGTKKVPEPFEMNRNAALQVAEESLYQTKAEDPLAKKAPANHFSNSSRADYSTDGAPESKLNQLQHTALGRVIGNVGRPEPVNHEASQTNVLKQKDHIFVEKPEQLNFFSEKLLTKQARSSYHILGQIFDTYWLISYEDKLLIIDQHAAHEKVKYEKLIQQLQKKEVLSQTLNPPVIVTLTSKEELILREYREHFRTLGFEIESFGGKEYAIRSVPMDLYGCKERQMFLSIMDELSETTLKGTPEVIYQKLASMSCKAAVKGNTSLSLAEMEQLIDQLLELDNPYHCPHGRPTMISMSKYEIEKKFKRIL